jgi:hypothetical protein
MKVPAPGLSLTRLFNFPPPHFNQREENCGQWNGRTHERRGIFLSDFALKENKKRLIIHPAYSENDVEALSGRSLRKPGVR